jgi:hypothetical protein
MDEETLNKENYKTRDIYLAATLITIGYNDYKIDKTDRLCYFIFPIDIFNDEIDQGVEADVDKFFAGNLLVDPKKLFQTFIDLKHRMWD